MTNVFIYTGQTSESIPEDITHVRVASYVEMIDGHRVVCILRLHQAGEY